MPDCIELAHWPTENGMTMAGAPEGIRVIIYDQEYHMRGQLDSEYIRTLADYVDSRMRSIAARSHTVDSLRTAVLTAVNVADEYHQLKARYEAMTRQVNQRVAHCHEVLDGFLGADA